MTATLAEARTQVLIEALAFVDAFENSVDGTHAEPELIRLITTVDNYRVEVEEAIKINLTLKKDGNMKTYIGTKIVQAEPMEQHHQNGFKVVYEDGYESWSPEDVFNRAYREINDGELSFGLAVEAMRLGKKVSRKGWNGPGQCLEIQNSDENSKMSLPYIYIKTVQGQLVPWLASQTDMLADDWFIVG